MARKQANTANAYRIRVHHQSAAKEFESYKQLPKFTKPSMAVIHPIGRGRNMNPCSTNPNLDVMPVSMNLKLRPFVDRDIPEHLKRANLPPPSKKKKVNMLKMTLTDNMTSKEKREALAKQAQIQLDHEKARNALKIQKILFEHIKQLLDRPES